MNLSIYQIDAFTDKIFSGNPAAVIPLKKWLPDEILQKIASENNLSETAFFIENKSGMYIRWFTPVAEVDLCGHATLASAHVLFEHLEYKKTIIEFQSKSGILKIEKTENLLWLDFPASTLKKEPANDSIIESLKFKPDESWAGRENILLVYKNEDIIRSINPDYEKIKELNFRGVIITSPGEKVDFVSRFFAPVYGINEDPVTGSAHTMLIPYWSKKLKKSELDAVQLSKRGGILACINQGDRVKIGGKAVTYLKGSIFI